MALRKLGRIKLDPGEWSPDVPMYWAIKSLHRFIHLGIRSRQSSQRTNDDEEETDDIPSFENLREGP